MYRKQTKATTRTRRRPIPVGNAIHRIFFVSASKSSVLVVEFPESEAVEVEFWCLGAGLNEDSGGR